MLPIMDRSIPYLILTNRLPVEVALRVQSNRVGHEVGGLR
jgi:hypothetical protein